MEYFFDYGLGDQEIAIDRYEIVANPNSSTPSVVATAPTIAEAMTAMNAYKGSPFCGSAIDAVLVDGQRRKVLYFTVSGGPWDLRKQITAR